MRFSSLTAAAAATVAALALGGCAAYVPAERPVDDSAEMATAAGHAGDAALRGGAAKEAAAIYRRGYERAPSAQLAVKLARAMRLSGDAQGGFLVLQDADARFPGNADILTEQGRCAMVGGYFDEAEETLRRAAGLPGAGWETWSAWGAAAARAGDLDNAEARFSRAKEAARSARETMAAMANLALLKAERGQLAESVAELEALARKPGADRRINGSLAVLRALSGDRAKFVQEVRRIASTHDDAAAAAAWAESLSKP